MWMLRAAAWLCAALDAAAHTAMLVLTIDVDGLQQQQLLIRLHHGSHTVSTVARELVAMTPAASEPHAMEQQALCSCQR